MTPKDLLMLQIDAAALALKAMGREPSEVELAQIASSLTMAADDARYWANVRQRVDA